MGRFMGKVNLSTDRGGGGDDGLCYKTHPEVELREDKE